MPDSVTVLGMSVFNDCNSLSKITLSKNITRIEGGMFTATAFTSFAVPNYITSIGGSAFAYCSELKSITIPDSVTSMGDYLFQHNSKLETVVIADSVTRIGDEFFSECSSLKTVKLPKKLSYLGKKAFYSCDNLESVIIPEGITSIQESTFSGSSRLKYVSIPDGVTTIESFAFYDCTSLTRLSIPGSVTSIKQYSFTNCSSLVNLEIPNSVFSLGYNFLGDCKNLKNLFVPDSVVSIDESNSFKGLSKLTISGYEHSKIQSFSAAKNIPFRSLGTSPGKIKYNGKDYQGSVMVDTKTYQMQPQNIYDIGVRPAGYGHMRTIKVVSSRDGIATVKKMPSGNYRVTGVKPGTSYIMITVYQDEKEITHASVKVTVEKGVKAQGTATRNTSYFN